jgi:mRNA interferase MazF
MKSTVAASFWPKHAGGVAETIRSRLSPNGIPKPIVEPMPIFDQGDIVRVPFPYTDRETRQHRPALIVSRSALGTQEQLLWVVMITSAENRRWPDDHDVGPNYREVGLPAASIIRPTKIATIESRDASQIGRIPRTLLRRVSGTISRNLAL